MDISSEGSSSYVGLAPGWYSRIGGQTAIGTRVTVELILIIRTASGGSILIEGNPGDMGSIPMSDNSDNGKSQGASGCMRGASGMTARIGGMSGSSTPCMRPR